jgi:PAS domain S-box-containing protein
MRIVWANPAGIAFFGGETLFDLLDRPFDAREHGVARIAALARTLARGQVETALLAFPSAGEGAAVACRCVVHALPDGRDGLLVAACHEHAAQAANTAAHAALAFDRLPAPAAIAGRDGTFSHLNAAAAALLSAGQRTGLARLLGDDALALDLLNRTEAAGTVAVTRNLALQFGPRDIRLTLKQLDGEDAATAFALLMLEDVTERRALERQLAPPPAATAPAVPSGPAPEPVASTRARTLPEPDAAVFERLGKAVEEGIRQLPAREAAPAADLAVDAAADTAPRRRLQRIPDQVRLPLENRSEAVLVAKDGQLLFANPAAARLFGHETGEDVINDDGLSSQFAALAQSLPACEFPGPGGRPLRAAVQMSVIPWLGGPARQFVVTPTEAEAPRQEPSPTPAPAPEQPAAEQPAPARASAEVIQLPLRQASPEADQELRAILDTAADGIITLDHEARIHTFSAGAEAIFGCRIAEVAGKPFVDLLAPDSRKTVRDYLAALQGPGLASVFNDGREVTARVAQGGTVPLFLTIGRLQASRSQAAFCAVVRDITQWKKTEAELREAKERAEATSRQKSEFLASVSHELRTPLNAIMGFSEVMRLGRFGEIDNEKYRGYVQDIHASGAHLLSLIDDLLDLSKVEAGRLELNFTSVNLGEVAEHAMKLLGEQATQARVVLRKSFPAGLPNVVADLRSMRQIMLNLLSNAIKFTDPGGQVVISAQLMGSGELKLRVKDSGIGMDEDQLRNALEPFRRVATEGRAVKGTGLGLPLTKALVEANRASFHLASEPRRGTLAEITFPTTRVLAE